VLYKIVNIESEITVEKIPIDRSLAVMVFDKKFEMGFSGTGPRQLALAILLDAFTTNGIPDTAKVAAEACYDFMLDHLSASKIVITSLLESIQLEDIINWYKARVCAK
jgi:hypothetical protein